MLTLIMQLLIALGLYTSPLDEPPPNGGGGAIEIPGGAIGAEETPLPTQCEECP